MFDLSWVELSFLAILALLVVGPKDLPKLARGAGKLWGRVRRLYRHGLQSIHKLETEIELATGADSRQAPDYYELLPEHIRRAMEVSEPSRDADHNQQVEALYQAAMNDLKTRTATTPGAENKEQDEPKGSSDDSGK